MNFLMSVAPWALAFIAFMMMIAFGREANEIQQLYDRDPSAALKSAYQGWYISTALAFFLMLIFIFAGI